MTLSINSAMSHEVAQLLLKLVSEIPISHKLPSTQPQTDAHKLAKEAAYKAALAAGTLALPPGPLGWLTIIPEIVTIWKIQAQLVADIAAIHGQSAQLTQEHMLYCLFRHSAAQVMRDVVVRLGDRFLIRPISLQVMQKIAQLIGLHISKSVLTKGIARYVPLIGAVGVASYAYYDTNEVAKTCIKWFNPAAI